MKRIHIYFLYVNVSERPTVWGLSITKSKIQRLVFVTVMTASILKVFFMG